VPLGRELLTRRAPLTSLQPAYKDTPVMNDDPRCCGSGTCIIDPQGRCWCGQMWDGEKMRQAPLNVYDESEPTDEPQARSGLDPNTP